jgi:uncharacterized protein YjbI with pentapeptide repeats
MAGLHEVTLSNAILRGAILTDTVVTDAQLAAAVGV